MQPNPRLALKVLPKPLYRAIVHVFAHCGEGVALVGGTALAGFYAGHRRSDDIDLFTKGEPAQRSAVLAIKSLQKIGARLLEEQQAPVYYHAVCELDGHTFTADAVLDENLHRIGQFLRVEPGILVAKLETLLAMKMAALVSRSSEKDLYDLRWLLAQEPKLDIAALIANAKEIDGGADAEGLLASVGGTQLREEACDFSLDPKIGKAKIFKEVRAEQKAWVKRLRDYLRSAPPPAFQALVREVKRKRKAK